MSLQLKVPSMMCEGCVETVTQAIEAKDSTATVNVDLDSKLVTVETQLSSESIQQAITAAGHTVEDKN